MFKIIFVLIFFSYEGCIGGCDETLREALGLEIQQSRSSANSGTRTGSFNMIGNLPAFTNMLSGHKQKCESSEMPFKHYIMPQFWGYFQVNCVDFRRAKSRIKSK